MSRREGDKMTKVSVCMLDVLMATRPLDEVMAYAAEHVFDDSVPDVYNEEPQTDSSRPTVPVKKEVMR
jgi:hypothetical protein